MLGKIGRHLVAPSLESKVIKGNNEDEQLDEETKHLKSLELLPRDETLRLRLKHIGSSVTLFFNERPLKILQGKGQYLYDDEGYEYLDCINNVSHVGHGNKHVQKAVSDQLALLNTNSRFLHDNLSIYAKRLTSSFPSQLSVCYLVNSGSEANDLAIRLSRSYTGRKDIISLEGAYHGNLTSMIAISSYKTAHIHDYKEAKWAHRVSLPDSYRHKFDEKDVEESGLGRLYAEEAAQVIEKAQEKGRQIAAMFVESMVSCGGQTPLPKGYLENLQNVLHTNGSLLICDEVQTGFGRCGDHMWAFQLAGPTVIPDIVTVGKPMGNGFPVSAVITKPEIADAFKNIGTEYFNTFGGNPASCAAALAVLDEIENEKLQQNAKDIGGYILKRLEIIKNKSKIIGDVRGHGFFLGMDVVTDLESKSPAPEYAQFLVNHFRDDQILMSTEGIHGNILKFKPPMVFNRQDAERFLASFERGLERLETSLES